MTEQTQMSRTEPRWPVGIAIVGVILLFVLLPGPIRLLPTWVTYVMGSVMLASVAAVGFSAGQPRWLRVERVVTLLFFVVSAVLIIANLANLISMMATRSATLSGSQLLTSSVGMWAANVLTFSLLFWQLDRGGPESRVNHLAARTDWLFPQAGAPEGNVPAGWQPVFVDYLYLAYSTATAFSATDVMPLTNRAKLLMMLESAISLATLLVVLARAINIFGS